MINRSVLFISLLSVLPQLFILPTVKNSLTLFFVLLFLLLLPRLSKTFFAIIILYLNLITLIQVHIAIHWGGYSSDLSSRIAVFLQSPKSETFEYLHKYIGVQDYLLGIYIVAVLGILIRFLFFDKSLQRVKSKFYIIVIVIFFAILQNQEPFKIVKYYFKTVEMSKAIHGRSNFLKNNIKESINTNDLNLYDKVLVIQGESANKHHLSLYSYSKKTTPHMNALLDEGKLYTFDAIAPTNQTRYSVPSQLTEANVLNWYTNYANSVSIVSDFKQYGYKTYWISNQAMHGLHEDSIFSIAMEADTQKFLASNTVDSASDEVIIDYLKNQNTTNEKQMYLFHLNGSHFDYKKRYKKEHALYNVPKNITEEYDNSIFYTDFVISKILEHFEPIDQKILLIYFSDHGEVVSRKKNGHGFFPSYKDEYEIPLVIYSSVKNKRLEELKFENYKHYFNTENLNYLIKYVSGISNEKNISTSSKIFSLSPKNVLDYEELKFYK